MAAIIDRALKQLYARVLQLGIEKYLITNRCNNVLIEHDLDGAFQACLDRVYAESSVAVLSAEYTGDHRAALGYFIEKGFADEHWQHGFVALLVDFLQWRSEQGGVVPDVGRVAAALVALGLPDRVLAPLDASHRPSQATLQEGAEMPDPRKVFVVHGRNDRARAAMFDFLRAVGLQPLEWGEACQEVGTPTPFVWDIVDAGFAACQTAVVLLTADDEVRTRSEYRQPGETDTFTVQPRPNVLIELGAALARGRDRAVLVQLGPLLLPTDIAGFHIHRMANAAPARHELKRRLQSAGATVTDGGSDWLTIGDFDGALVPYAPSPPSAPSVDGRSELPDLDDQQWATLRYVATVVHDGDPAMLRFRGYPDAKSVARHLGVSTLSAANLLNQLLDVQLLQHTGGGRSPNHQFEPTPAGIC